MAEAELILRRWGGSSLAVVIPKETVTKERLKEGDRLRILIEKKTDLSNVFGSYKTKTSGQKFKEMCKKSAE